MRDAKRVGAHLVIDGKCGLGPFQQWRGGGGGGGLDPLLVRENKNKLCPHLERDVDSALTGCEWGGVMAHTWR